MSEIQLQPQSSLIIGANSGIASAISRQSRGKTNHHLIRISRDVRNLDPLSDKRNKHQIQVDAYQPEAIAYAVDKVAKLDCPPITQVFICNGILHQDKVFPEKRIEDFDASAFNEVINANALTPMLWLQKLLPLINHKAHCKVVIFSARVGSISDNNLGGWYSYRASKSALNMLLKSAAIEFARRAKNVKLIAFHPGTTDTELSKPFQNNVPQGKLFSCDFVADRLLTVVEQTQIDGELSYVDWQGKTIGW